MGLQVDILKTMPITGDDQLLKKQMVRAIVELAAAVERTQPQSEEGT